MGFCFLCVTRVMFTKVSCVCILLKRVFFFFLHLDNHQQQWRLVQPLPAQTGYFRVKASLRRIGQERKVTFYLYLRESDICYIVKLLGCSVNFVSTDFTVALKILNLWRISFRARVSKGNIG